MGRLLPQTPDDWNGVMERMSALLSRFLPSFQHDYPGRLASAVSSRVHANVLVCANLPLLVLS